MIDVGTPIAQGALPHGPMTLFSGPRTVAQAGCLVSCLVMVARAITPAKTLSLTNALQTIHGAGAHIGSALVVPDAARLLGIRLHERAAFGLRACVEDLVAGRPVVVGIDYKPGRSSGLSDADHFVVVVGEDAGELVCVDPASGGRLRLHPTRTEYKRTPSCLAEMLRFAPLPH